MKPMLIEMIDKARGYSSIPYKVTSGFRTKEHNKNVGGTDNSSHMRGWAVDISARTNQKRIKIVSGLLKAGFTRIGIAQTFVHADCDPTKGNSLWLYPTLLSRSFINTEDK